MMNTRRLLLKTMLAGVAMSATRIAAAQSTFPDRPLKLIVPYSAGGGTDFFARTVAPGMSAALGQPVVVENRPGASGLIAAAEVTRTFPADGYSILLCNKSIGALNSYMYSKLPYDPEDIEAVSMGGRFDYLLVVNENVLPAKTVADIVSAARRAPNGLNYASPSIGTAGDIAGELFVRASGGRMTKIAYKGGAPAIQDLLAGHVAFMFSDRASLRPYVDSGKLRAIAVTGSQRIASYPDLPTMAESGYPGFAVDDWLGFTVRKGTPAQAIEAIRVAYAKTAESAELRRRLSESGITVEPSSSKEFATVIHNERQLAKEVMPRLGIRLD